MAVHRSERLRFVRIDEMSGSHIWWPALLYESYKCMIQDQDSYKVTVHMALKFRGTKPGSSWAVLLGKNRPIHPFVSIAPNELESKVIDFIAELQDMEDMYSKRKAWNVAMNESLSILEDFAKLHPVQDLSNPFGDSFRFYDVISQDGALAELEEEGSSRDEEDVEPESGHKLDASMDNSDGLILSKGSHEDHDSSEHTECPRIEERPKRKAANSTNEPSQKKAKIAKKTQKNHKKSNSGKAAKKANQKTSREKIQKILTSSTDSKSCTSQITPQKNETCNENNKPVSIQLEQYTTFESDDEWKQVMNVLRFKCGFYLIQGSGLHQEYWVSGKCKKVEDEKSLKKHLKANDDYFIGEESLKEYAHNTYGWVGPSTKPFSPLLKKRQRKSRQTNKNMGASTTRSSGEQQPLQRKMSSKSEKKQHEIESQNTPKRIDVSTRNKKSSISHDTTQTLKMKLDKCISRLSLKESDHSNDTLYTASKSNQDSILNFLETFLNGESSNSSLMYVCGNPGMGKTTLVRHCVQNIFSKRDFCRELFLNASSLPSPESILEEITKAIGTDVTNDQNAIEKALKSTKKRKKIKIILVIDEIDFLLKDLVGKKKMKENSAFSSILSWASDPACRMALIGISNSVGDNNARLLHNCAKVTKELVFKPYGVDDLKGIILKRLGVNGNLVEEKALEYVTKKIAKNNGDARVVIDTFSKAFVVCKESLSSEELACTKVDTPVLKVAHILKVLPTVGIGSHVEIIKGLPQKVQTVLCVASALHQISDSWRDIPLSDLKTYCMEATDRGLIDEEMQSESFQDMVGQLEDAGLICTGGMDEITSGDQYYDFMDKSIRVGAQLEDVECAIEKSLLQNPIYQKIVDNVKRKGIAQNFS